MSEESIKEVTETKLKEIQEKRKQSEDQFEELFEKMKEGKYLGQTYGKDSTVEIPGPLFAEFINYVNTTKSVLENLQQNIAVIHGTADFNLNDAALISIKLMNQHMSNVDAGKTVTQEEMDKQDAKSQIKEKK